MTSKIQTIPKADILILTETHELTEKGENTEKWQSKQQRNHNSTQTTSKEILNIHKDNEGYFISINLEYEKEIYQIIVYLESNDNVSALNK